MADWDSLNHKIETIRLELDEEYYLLGKNIFESTDKANIRISTLIDRLIDYRIKLHALGNIVKCADCGAENTYSNNFCLNCGKELNHLE